MIEVHTLENKSFVVNYLYQLGLHEIPDCDIIDVSGAVLASDSWAEFCNQLNPRAAVWRVALLRPDSAGAHTRANESTVWCGDVDHLNEAIRTRSECINRLASRLGITAEIRYYSDIPVTRYMQIAGVSFESYYPPDSTGASTEISILPCGSVLALRVAKEFAVLWQRIEHFEVSDS